jgi:hypothetical protein
MRTARNGGSDCVGANALSTPTFWKDGTIRITKLRYNANNAPMSYSPASGPGSYFAFINMPSGSNGPIGIRSKVSRSA